MKAPRIVLLLAFLNLWITSGAQEPAYRQFDTESGLPSNEVFNIMFDKDMVLWAATSRGVCRYDGMSWKTFTMSDGLNENVHLRIFFPEQDQRIWTSSINNHLSVQKGHLLVPAPYSKALAIPDNNGRFIQQIGLRGDTLMVAFNDPGLYKITPDGMQEKVTGLFNGHSRADICLFACCDGYYWDMQSKTGHEMPRTTRIEKVGDRTYITLHYKNIANANRKYIHRIGEDPGHFLISFGNTVIHVRGDSVIGERRFENQVMALYADIEGNFWIGVDFEGLYRFQDQRFDLTPFVYLEHELVTGILQDHEGNYWISTRGNGLFMMNTSRMAVYHPSSSDTKDRIVRGFDILNDKMYYGTESGKLFRIDDSHNPEQVIHRQILKSGGPMRKVMRTDQNTLLLMSDRLIETNARGDTSGFRSFNSYPYAMTRLSGGNLMVTYPDAYHLIHPGGSREVTRGTDIRNAFPDSLHYHKAMLAIRTLFEDRQGALWMGSQYSGVMVNRGGHPESIARLDSLLSLRTSGIAQMGDRMVFGISEHGIIVLHPDRTTTRIGQEEGLSSEIVDAIFAENDTTLWVGTGQGLNRIHLDPQSYQPDSIQYFTMREGLPSNRIYQIGSFRDKIWVATTRGLLALEPNVMLPTYTIPYLTITDFRANEISYPDQQHYELKAHENSLSISFSAISYRKHKDILHRYRLVGHDKNWIISENLQAIYNGLKGGRYSFEIEAWYPENPANLNKKSIQIDIAKKFTEKSLFIVLLVALSVALIYLIIRYVVSIIERRELEKQQLMMAEKKALLAQMNPHFIFNALNSVQYFILQREEFVANNYLFSFSSLIRRILQNSQKNLITLSEEIETLMLYLDMEKLRFEEPFDYLIIKDSNLEYSDTLVPPMLIQPFIENAIWHGLAPLPNKGDLRISFLEGAGFFETIIEDNGIGRKKSAEKNEKRINHQSTGIRNVEERIRLMNRMNEQKIRLAIQDLYHPDGSAEGTRVTLKIPMQWR